MNPQWNPYRSPETEAARNNSVEPSSRRSEGWLGQPLETSRERLGSPAMHGICGGTWLNAAVWTSFEGHDSQPCHRPAREEPRQPLRDAPQACKQISAADSSRSTGASAQLRLPIANAERLKSCSAHQTLSSDRCLLHRPCRTGASRVRRRPAARSCGSARSPRARSRRASGRRPSPRAVSA